MNTAFMPQVGRSHASSMWKTAGPVILCGITGLVTAFTVPIVGKMPVAEFILVGVFIWVLIRAFMAKGWPTRIQQLGWYKLLLILIAITAIGYIVSDLYRGTANANIARGWARVGFLGIDLVALAFMIDGSWTRLQVFAFAYYTGNCAVGLLGYADNSNWWEFGAGPVTTALVLFLCAGRMTLIQSGAAVALGAVAMFLGARSLGGIALLTGVAFGLSSARGMMRPIAFIAAAGALALLLFAANAVILGNLDKKASNIERRSMIETAGEAFISSPLIGQGSWFTTARLLAKLEDRRASLDPTFHGYTEEEVGHIAIHSQILVALAEGGILGGAFFIGYGALLLKSLRTLSRYPVPHRAFVLYMLFDGLWNLFMSPFSGPGRIGIDLCVCACLMVILQRQGELSEDFRE